jgi:hypothetical protein
MYTTNSGFAPANFFAGNPITGSTGGGTTPGVFLLLETSDYLLLETNNKIVKEV